MKQILTIENLALNSLNEEELYQINGGHKGEAYEAGKAVGEMLSKLAGAIEKLIIFL